MPPSRPFMRNSWLLSVCRCHELKQAFTGLNTAFHVPFAVPVEVQDLSFLLPQAGPCP